jgi:hypothetical protein
MTWPVILRRWQPPAVDSLRQPVSSLPVVSNTYDYDGMGRLVKEVDNAGGPDATGNRTTTYAYDVETDGTTETIAYPNGESETIVTNLDGTRASVSGTATTPGG